MSPKKDDINERVLSLELERKNDKEKDAERDRLLREIHREIVGSENTAGLRVRVDRLERTNKGLKWVLGLTLTMISTLSGFHLFGK